MTPLAERLRANIEHAAATPWPDGVRRLGDGRWYWLATSSTGGGPHVRPVLAVVLDEVAYFVANAASRKARNLALSAVASLSTAVDDAHLVIEGTASIERDPAALERVAHAYASKYAWHVRVQHGAFDADYGAPTAGPPPYDVYALRPHTVYAFGVTEHFSPTRYRFA
jgi:hypothetical protein